VRDEGAQEPRAGTEVQDPYDVFALVRDRPYRRPVEVIERGNELPTSTIVTCSCTVEQRLDGYALRHGCRPRVAKMFSRT
jgi:hypothetical protein